MDEMSPRMLQWCLAVLAYLGTEGDMPDFLRTRDRREAWAARMEVKVARLFGCRDDRPCWEHRELAQRALQHPTFPACRRGDWEVPAKQTGEWLNGDLGRELAATLTSCMVPILPTHDLSDLPPFSYQRWPPRDHLAQPTALWVQ